MTTAHPVPADLDPAGLDDLVADAREMNGTLSGSAVDLTALPRLLKDLPHPRPPMPAIDLTVLAARLDGYAEYGS